MLGGSIDVSQVGGAAAVGAAANGAEIAILGTVFTRLTFAIHASPQIKQISDLKGKTIAAGAVGGNSYFAALAFLRHFGWVANRDVGVLSAGGSPEVLAGLLQGKFQAGVLTPPTSHAAAKAGHREIFDLAGLDFPFPVISIVSTRKFIDAYPDTILNILRATSEAIYLYKTRPDLTLPVVAKYMRVPKDDPALVQSQEGVGQIFESVSDPIARRNQIRAGISSPTSNLRSRQKIPTTSSMTDSFGNSRKKASSKNSLLSRCLLCELPMPSWIFSRPRK